MSRSRAGTYTPDINRAFNPRSQANRETPETCRLPYENLRPVGRIVRKFAWQDMEVQEGWNDFINDFADQNYGQGTVRALGSMGVTFVDTNAMHRMLSEKNPKAFGGSRPNHQQMRKTLHGISKRYNKFALDNEADNFKSFGDHDYDPGIEPRIKAWFPRIFRLGRHLKVTGSEDKTLAFSFTPDESQSLREEYNETLKFLKQSEGLNTRHVQKYDFHMTFFDAFVPVSILPLSPPKTKQPEKASLRIPRMTVDENKRQDN